MYLNIKKLPIAGSPKSHCRRIQVLGIDARLILLAGPHKKHQNGPLSPEKPDAVYRIYWRSFRALPAGNEGGLLMADTFHVIQIHLHSSQFGPNSQ